MKTVPETGPSTSPSAAGSSSAMPAISESDARTGDRRAEEHRMHERAPGLRRERLAQPAVRDARLVVDVRGQERVVALREHEAQPGGERRVGRAPRREARRRACRGSRTDPIGTIAGVSRSGDAPAGRVRRPRRDGRSCSRRSASGRAAAAARASSSGVCDCTPSTAETTSTAPSSTLSTRSTSAMKSGWPGVSIRLTVTSSIANDTTADLIVIPRCRSSASESVWVLPSSTLPISSMTPAA